jgi:hypothetical protein
MTRHTDTETDTETEDSDPDVPLNWDFLDELPPRLAVNVEAVWTVLCRAYESPRMNWSGNDVWHAFEVYLDREEYLDTDEIEHLKLFEKALVNQDRDPGRSFSNPNAVETEFLRTLRTGARRRRAELETAENDETADGVEVSD